ncbi:MAG: alkylation response protein AidB-like acyl-CoA dehydrogenase [Mariniblastus sp.]|jgi:alkylation response protein AidB-like acyl-CoA dehydrogenase
MNPEAHLIESIDSPHFELLCQQLSQSSSTPGHNPESSATCLGWPARNLELIANSGAYRWFVPKHLGGVGWTSPNLAAGYVQLAAACLTTTFIITQRVAAIRRICGSDNHSLRDQLLPGLLDGSQPATVGISHLTTSRRHLQKPALAATKHDGGYTIDGFSPWVTGGQRAAHLVMGAELESGEQVLFAIPQHTPGVSVAPWFDLVALSNSQTGPVKCEQVTVAKSQVLAGPSDNVLALAGIPSTGSLQTSSLAIGLSQAAIEFIRAETKTRPDLEPVFNALNAQLVELKYKLLTVASGDPICTNEDLRTDANSLVLRATQAAMVAAKGTGYVKGHPVGRWCQEALFFLVWSCPQSVLNANLCELAGIE